MFSGNCTDHDNQIFSAEMREKVGFHIQTRIQRARHSSDSVIE